MRLSEKTKAGFYFVFRVLVGLMFLQHGAQKLFGAFNGPGLAGFAGFAGIPIWLAGVVGVVEFVGGIFIVIGLFTRTSAIVSTINLIVALILVHFPNGTIPVMNGGELAIVYIAAFLVLIANGSGRWAVDNLIRR
ncbi:MAG: DoxX family protein [Nanoarchaeota archaeon]